MHTSEQIREEITKQLEWDSRINSKDISVKVENNIVTLDGSVFSYMQKIAAETDAFSIPGVSEVHNHLKIAPYNETGKYTDDQVLWNINTLLALNPAVNLKTLEISVKNGTSYLSGSVDEYWKKLQIEELIYDIPGVQNVVNTLSVVPSNAPFDELIASEIQETLQRVSNINIEQINIIVEGGRVTLHGVVPDWHAYSAAHNAAKYTRGVTDLTNKLIIKQ